MCGIGGFYRANEGYVTPWEKEAILDLWIELEKRGNMAAGVAIPSPDNSISIMKGVGPSSELGPKVWKGVWHKNGMPRWVMLHTRLTTHGSAWNNLNNHPMMSANVVLSHNGVIWNHSKVLDELGVKPAREVDTEAILQCIVRGGVDEVVQHVRGSYSIAYSDEPGSLCLFTNGSNPLVYARLYNGNYFYASTRAIIESLGLRFKYIKDVAPGVLYRFNLNGLTTTTYKLPKLVARKPSISTDWRDYAGKQTSGAKTAPKGKQTTFKGMRGYDPEKEMGKPSLQPSGIKKVDDGDIDFGNLVPRRGWRHYRDAY